MRYISAITRRDIIDVICYGFLVTDDMEIKMTYWGRLDEITFLDIYRAVECVEDGQLFHFHENPNHKCPVGRNIHNVLDDKLKQVQDAMECELGKITIKDVISDTKRYINAEKGR